MDYPPSREASDGQAYMKFVADLHLHSKYSRAVSPQMILSEMARWAKYKGINVLATGDFTHPFWLDKLRTELEEAGNGLYRLKSVISNVQSQMSNLNSEVYFLLSCEIASIYSQGGKTRRIHTLFFFPKLASVEKFNQELIKRGANLRSDGRPIVGINSRDLAAIALECDEKALVVPAHAWTPWFSVFGSFSGFDSIEECFGDMAKDIYAIETGLSSDPVMNWQVGDLDNRAIISFSDAHSLEKMGREATVFEADEISYDSIYQAIRQLGSLAVGPEPNSPRGQKTKSLPRIAFTIEFHPEEGKYHYTGHRGCNFSQTPEESKINGNICPVCHRPLTVGVMHRVEDLATREEKPLVKEQAGVKWQYKQDNQRPPYVSLVPLLEILAEVHGLAFKTKRVMETYLNLINNLGSELSILLKADLAEVSRFSNARVAEGIERVRNGKIVVEPGYDGKFGIVKIWDAQDSQSGNLKEPQEAQLGLF